MSLSKDTINSFRKLEAHNAEMSAVWNRVERDREAARNRRGWWESIQPIAIVAGASLLLLAAAALGYLWLGSAGALGIPAVLIGALLIWAKEMDGDLVVKVGPDYGRR